MANDPSKAAVMIAPSANDCGAIDAWNDAEPSRLDLISEAAPNAPETPSNFGFRDPSVLFGLQPR